MKLTISTASDDQIYVNLGDQRIEHDGGEKSICLSFPPSVGSRLKLPIRISYDGDWVTEISVPDGSFIEATEGTTAYLLRQLDEEQNSRTVGLYASFDAFVASGLSLLKSYGVEDAQLKHWEGKCLGWRDTLGSFDIWFPTPEGDVYLIAEAHPLQGSEA